MSEYNFIKSFISAYGKAYPAFAAKQPRGKNQSTIKKYLIMLERVLLQIIELNT